MTGWWCLGFEMSYHGHYWKPRDGLAKKCPALKRIVIDDALAER
jgi:hypothetical protein